MRKLQRFSPFSMQFCLFSINLYYSDSSFCRAARLCRALEDQWRPDTSHCPTAMLVSDTYLVSDARAFPGRSGRPARYALGKRKYESRISYTPYRLLFNTALQICYSKICLFFFTDFEKWHSVVCSNIRGHSPTSSFNMWNRTERQTPLCVWPSICLSDHQPLALALPAASSATKTLSYFVDLFIDISCWCLLISRCCMLHDFGFAMLFTGVTLENILVY